MSVILIESHIFIFKITISIKQHLENIYNEKHVVQFDNITNDAIFVAFKCREQNAF